MNETKFNADTQIALNEAVRVYVERFRGVKESDLSDELQALVRAWRAISACQPASAK